MGDRLTEAILSDENCCHCGVDSTTAAVLALVESDEARQVVSGGLHDKDCGCDGPTDDYYDELADAAQAALVAYLKGESDD